ncbi:Uncharacterized protein FKW44_014146, partial [Caligus rogercresseyi]
MQSAVAIVLDCGRTNGLTFNATKYNAIVFSKAYKFRSKHFPRLKIDDKEKVFSTPMRYLGILFDQGLTGRATSKEKAAKCSPLRSMAKAVIRQKWGLT